MKSEILNPRDAANGIIKSLEQLSNPEGIKGAQRFFKYPISTYGIKATTLRCIAKEWQGKLKPAWDLDKAIELCDILMRQNEIDSKMVGVLILAEFSKSFKANMLPTIKIWLENYCDNWAIVDGLAPWVVGPLIDKYPELIPKVISWRESPVMWVRRGAVVAFLPHVRKGKYLDTAYALCESLFGDQEDLMHKALGWLLREAGKADSSRLEKFLLAHGSKIPRTTVRYAIERFPETDRKRLLQETRKKLF